MVSYYPKLALAIVKINVTFVTFLQVSKLQLRAPHHLLFMGRLEDIVLGRALDRKQQTAPLGTIRSILAGEQA